MSMNIRLGGKSIRQPSDFKISRYNLTKSGRVASGKMKMDLIAKKRKFFFTYEILSGAEQDVILSVIDGKAMFFNISYVENGVSKSATVYVGEIDYGRFRTGGLDGWYWKGMSFNLIEQ